MVMEQATEVLKNTVLSEYWQSIGGKMVPFAGYNMPVQFKEGVAKEHLWTRENCGLFDVSHMGPCFFRLKDRSGLTDEEAHVKVAKILEQVLPCDIQGLKRGQIRYTQLLNDEGGIIDDLMIARDLADCEQGSLYIVVNAGGKEVDFEIFNKLGEGVAHVERRDENGLIALQGPKAKDVMAKIIPDAVNLNFMNFSFFKTENFELIISRSGYTGEDGFEILVAAKDALKFVETLLSDDNVKPIGLGARDSLRLEAGLCLYGHDLDETISPVEADIQWSIQKVRRESADFKGADRILKEIAEKPSRKRVGILPFDRAPAREGTKVFDKSGNEIGIICSGGFGPSLNAPIAMAYLKTEFTTLDTEVDLLVREKLRPAKVCALPFIPNNYYKAK